VKELRDDVEAGSHRLRLLVELVQPMELAELVDVVELVVVEGFSR